MSTDGPFRGAFPHQHGDPQSLRERIDAQLRERIGEAVEMAALEMLVEGRKREQRALPAEDNARDRAEFHAIAEEVLEYLDRAFRVAVAPADLEALEAAVLAAPSEVHAQRLAGQVLLAKRLPDYWQRFEAHRAELATARLGSAQSAGWLKRLFRG